MSDHPWWHYPIYAACWAVVLFCDVMLAAIREGSWRQLRAESKLKLKW